jgi:hypothetical protein
MFILLPNNNLLAIASALVGVATPVAHSTGICNPPTTTTTIMFNCMPAGQPSGIQERPPASQGEICLSIENLHQDEHIRGKYSSSRSSSSSCCTGIRVELREQLQGDQRPAKGTSQAASSSIHASGSACHVGRRHLLLKHLRWRLWCPCACLCSITCGSCCRGWTTSISEGGRVAVLGGWGCTASYTWDVCVPSLPSRSSAKYLNRPFN